MIETKFSEKIKAINRRVDKLPKLLNMKLSAATKKRAELFIKIFQAGIRNREFGLKRLSSATIEQKVKRGYTKPSTPLYGAGDSEQNSLLNVFLIKKLKNGWQVYPRNARHHKSKLKLKWLLAIHEEGAIIRVTDRMRRFLHYIGIHLRADTMLIRIPPRPAQRLAYQEMLRQIAKEDPVPDIKKAIKKLMNEGKEPSYGLKEI